MREDDLYLIFCYLIYFVTLGLLVYFSNNRWRTALINILIVALYSSLFIYNLMYNSAGGTGLVWLVFLMGSLCIHWLVNLLCVCMKLYRSKVQ